MRFRSATCLTVFIPSPAEARPLVWDFPLPKALTEEMHGRIDAGYHDGCLIIRLVFPLIEFFPINQANIGKPLQKNAC